MKCRYASVRGHLIRCAIYATGNLCRLDRLNKSTTEIAATALILESRDEIAAARTVGKAGGRPKNGASWAKRKPQPGWFRVVVY